jgi:hypothetical protein
VGRYESSGEKIYGYLKSGGEGQGVRSDGIYWLPPVF